MTVTPHQLDLYTADVLDLYRALESDIFEQICRRLKAPSNVNILDWQLEKMAQLKMINSYTLKKVSALTGKSEDEIKRIFNDVDSDAITSVDSELKEVFDPKPVPTDLDRIISAYASQTFLDLNNYVNQTLITTNYGTGSVSIMYQQIINETTAKVLTGIKTFDQALEETIVRFADKGIASAFIDKGGHKWSMERYVDTVIRSTLNRSYNELRTGRMAEYDVYTVVMSSLMDSAKRCSRCQGQILDMRRPGEAVSGYPSIYLFGYGLEGGTLGVHCRHSVTPFIPGVNVNNQPKYEKEEIRKRYEMREKQREIERRIRKTKKNILISKELESDKLEHYNKLLRSQQAQMRDLLSQPYTNHLRRNYKREKVYTT
ncbi:capsid protein [Listeria monocytogenes]|uniref:phage minor capsid protein n=1 Tax=Listeria monocytogenes TaxID=1639 RepID=UPI00077B1327|nr:phage minor capsid protein [Listeria monocytogenes]EAC2379280.1 capsid protein [Listeria monocytogenes]EAE1596987.1 capsid protein [Listeria monocytogenes]EAE1602427.1 capsid protein [Listeria monocytogenes]EAG2064004.1 capsid protein [Listeria monocytogenes]EDN7757676.1 capsid protein [Listeria monocytogenes]